MAYLGEIRIFAANFNPSQWVFCAGQFLSISSFPELFSLIGTTYGGNGITYFALPNLFGRVPLNSGTLAGNSYTMAQKGGLEKVTMQANNLPAHRHKISGNVYQPVLGENPGQLLSPDNAYLAVTPGEKIYSTVKDGSNRMGALKLSMQLQDTGRSVPIENLQPFLAINFVICIYGDIPPRPQI